MNLISCQEFTEQFWTDALFRDYFNKFCCLPIFGQRAAFLPSASKFVLDPPPVRAAGIRENVANESVFEWLYKNRLHLFNRSIAGSEFFLCQNLRQESFLFENDGEVFQNLENLKQRYLEKVRHVVKFIEFIESTKHDANLVRFWMGVDRLYHSDTTEKGFLLRAIVRKYLMKTSRCCLPDDITSQIYPGDCGSRGFDYDGIIKLQEIVFQRLHFYWLPQYIMTCTDVTKEEAKRLRKIQLKELGFYRGKTKLIEDFMRRCNLVRFTNEPDRDYLETDDVNEIDVGDESVVTKHYDDAEEEKENFLINKLDTLFIADNADRRKSSTIVGVGNVKMIHETVFKQDSVRTDDEIHIFPGRTVTLRPPAPVPSPTSPPSTTSYEADVSSCAISSNQVPYGANAASSQFEADAMKLPNDQEQRIVKSNYDVTMLLPPLNEVEKSRRRRSMSASNRHEKYDVIRISQSSDVISDSSTSSVCWLTSCSSDAAEASLTSSSDFSCGDVDGYLKRAEPDMTFSDILSSDEAAGFPFRKFLSRTFGSLMRNDDNAGGDCEKNENYVDAIDLWRKIETLRMTYFRLDTTDISARISDIKKGLKDSKYATITALKLSPDDVFPQILQDLQLKFETLIEKKWVRFASSEQREFKATVISEGWEVLKRRNSFPNCPIEHLVPPILNYPCLPSSPILGADELETNLKLGNLGGLSKHGNSQMRYRVSRAYRLLMKTTGYDVTSDIHYTEYVGDESSDDEGGIPSVPPIVYSRFPDIDSKDIASLSAQEYPKKGVDYSKYSILRIIPKRHKIEKQPLYMRPIRKKGLVMKRPPQRPKNLTEVLRDQVHFEFFKRYMKLQKSEVPLLFWKAVELLKRSESSLSRQQKAQQILKKFFGRLAGGGVMLQCDSDIIAQISNFDTVTTSMLAQAQVEVMKSMEKHWAQRYLDTFPPDPSPEVAEVVADKRLGINAFKTKLRHIWEAFSIIMRRAARFIKCMKDVRIFEEFRAYLKSVPIREITKTVGGGDASSTDFAKNNPMFQHDSLGSDVIEITKELCGRTVILNLLADDLAFWFEVDRYVTLTDNIQSMVLAGCYDTRDSDFVKEKMETIVNCFLDSCVAPRIRVNVTCEVAEAIRANIQGGVYERGVFHEGVMQVFPLLLHYWKPFRQEKFTYVPRRTIRQRHRGEVLERRRRRMKRIERENKRKLQISVSETTVATDSSIANSISTSDEKFERVKGIIQTDPPTFHFSLEHGLKLIIPPGRKKLGRPQEPGEEFMNVWTRGANVVNVFREGSNPKLIDTNERKKDFKVKCDLLQ